MDNRLFRYSLFFSLYFAQGALFAYIKNFHKPYLHEAGVSASNIGMLSGILLIPFILKVFIGILSDRVNLFGRGHRIPYIFVGLILASLGFLLAGTADLSQGYYLYGLFMFLASTGVCLYDSCTDGFAIDTTPLHEESRIQSIMTTGRASGFILLSFLFGFIATKFGYSSIFQVVAVVLLLPLFLLKKAKEPASLSNENKFQWSSFRVFKQPIYLIFAIYTVYFSIVAYGLDGIITYYMSKVLKSTNEQIGNFGSFRGIGTIVGVGVFTLMSRKWNPPIVAVLTVLLITVVTLMIRSFEGMADTSNFHYLGLVWGLVWGIQEVLFLCFAMKLANKNLAASMFAIFMAFINMGTAIGEATFTRLTGDHGFAAVFFLLMMLNIAQLPLLWLLFRKAPQLRSF